MNIDEEAACAALGWLKLAIQEGARARYYEGRHEFSGVRRLREKQYTEVAKALRLQACTGIPHCSEHMVPFERCREQHGARR